MSAIPLGELPGRGLRSRELWDPEDQPCMEVLEPCPHKKCSACAQQADASRQRTPGSPAVPLPLPAPRLTRPVGSCPPSQGLEAPQPPGSSPPASLLPTASPTNEMLIYAPSLSPGRCPVQPRCCLHAKCFIS